MKRRKFIRKSGIALALFGASSISSSCSSNPVPSLGRRQVQHGLIFSLKHKPGSEEAEKLLSDMKRILSGIPVVQNFQLFRQVNSRTDYEYGFSMVFDNERDYRTYLNHPDHVAFGKESWNKEVAKYLEIDFKVWGDFVR